MARRLNTFLITVTGVLLLWFAYLGHQLIGLTSLDPLTKLFLWLVLAAPFCLMLWLPARYWREDSSPDTRLRTALLWGSYLSMALLSFLIVLVISRDLFWLVVRDPRIYDVPASLSVIGLALMAVGVGVALARRTPRVKRVDIPIADLPPELDGFRIAQISDLHIGAHVRRRFVIGVVRLVNALEADLVALTGDIFDCDPEGSEEHFEPLRHLRARDGRFYVTGNHEYYWNADQWISEVRCLGIRPLINSHVVIERGKARLVVAGVADFWASRSQAGAACDPAAAVRGAPEGVVRILLAHQPQTALKAQAQGFALQLSGHTHGGQFFPWTIVVSFVHRFARGLHRFGRGWIYVSQGTGFWGPPVRLGTQSEVTLLTLRRRP